MLLDQDTRKAGPVLRDGTPFEDLIDYEKFEVSMRLLQDPDVYEYELEHLFAQTWNLVGHVTEIPESGDYVMRYIGEDSVIVTRDKDGAINVLLNVCTHRGMMVCRSEGGKGNQFKCPYHGWTFSNTGRFLGAPIAREQMHGNVLTKEQLGLKKARVTTYAGMIFATWNEDPPTIEEHLGGIKWYLDLMFDRTPDGLEVFGPPQRFMINANWKCAGEQHAGDGYHTLTLHHSLNELSAMAGGDDRPTAQAGLNVSANGHGLRCIDMRIPFIPYLVDKVHDGMTPMERLTVAPPAGLTPEQVPALTERFDEGQLRVLAEFAPQVGGLFPNIGCFSLPFPTADGLSAIIALHAFVPKGPDRFEFFNWFLVEKSASQEMREEQRRVSNLAFGISGFVETDDADTWPQMTESAKGVIGRHMKLRYQALTGENKPADWPGTGHVYDGFGKDDNQWNWWKQYFQVMTGGPVA
jgi:phenylpropionate dioxygenase-like ring-hydroxylating dioxygenase large terminal subunit